MLLDAFTAWPMNIMIPMNENLTCVISFLDIFIHDKVLGLI
ncbi:protein of unknown function [Candidatus Nitrosocosmicus franklandus]|uniref:Uncharacterized protein n=1 Tax=Candidatus Nitrosocosmicus franklandianus TaxID=1798806 RepID=A0A484I9E4_9ARCH|nr:protein of unknown function [Candidatus Nitrosocosmicus franklandus]